METLSSRFPPAISDKGEHEMQVTDAPSATLANCQNGKRSDEHEMLHESEKVVGGIVL